MADSDDLPEGPAPDPLADELIKKYDPERLLGMVAKRAGRGESLDASLRGKYERRFGVDLSHVRLYTGEFAEEFNRKRGAYAVTIGSTGMILMGGSADRSMGSAAGQALLAHELAHVAQGQRAQGATGGVVRRSAKFDDQLPFAEEAEVEAEAVEQDVLHEEQGGAASGGDAPAQSSAVVFEQIKRRVMEMLGDAARAMELRDGIGLRRP